MKDLGSARSATPIHFQLTIIDSASLMNRLGGELAFLATQIRSGSQSFKSDPINFARHEAVEYARRLWVRATPQFLTGSIISIAVVLALIFVVSLGGLAVQNEEMLAESETRPIEIVTLTLPSPEESPSSSNIGANSNGRVGFNTGKGEGSNREAGRAQGGGGGGDLGRLPSQVGAIPQPSEIHARIPTTPPTHVQALPVAGVDIDPLLWKDLSFPVYGDPRSKSSLTSSGPGQDGGIGDDRGLGIGEGDGPGVGPGRYGNIGGNSRARGGNRIGGGSACSEPCTDVFTVRQVDQRARLLAKPEPQYTEEARRNQIMGTVILRVVFSSSGEVTNIQAVKTLPLGLTERAIMAARRIRFVPAIKAGRPVSVHMQLEYNFNLY